MNNLLIVDGHSDFPVYVFQEREKGNQQIIETNHLSACAKGGVVMEVATVGGDFENRTWNGKKPDTVLKTLGYIHEEVNASSALRLVLKKDDLTKIGLTGTLSIMLNLEGAACVTDDFSLLQEYYNMGVRAMSLTHNHINIFAQGCAEPSGRGLTDLGKRLIREIDTYDMIIDLAHINERCYFQVLGLTQRPVIVSHSNARKICNSRRNLTDAQLIALAEKGGVVGLNCLGFLIDEVFENQTIDRLLDHLEYIVELIGIDHVGFGPDYNDYMIDDTKKNLSNSPLFKGELQYAIGAVNISSTQVVVESLLNRNYNEEDIRKIMGGNFLRVYMEGLPE